jgi:CRP/FNR family transcriptional regulator, cyclic AMP receptor protein
MTMDRQLTAHPFLSGLTADELALLAAHATATVFPAGARIFDEGGDARRFWLLEAGRVRLDTLIPGRGPVIVETLGPGSVLGWSWLFPPYRWHFGAEALEATQAVELDAAAVRGLCDGRPELGYKLTNAFLQVVIDRLQNTRIRLLDLYGNPS